MKFINYLKLLTLGAKCGIATVVLFTDTEDIANTTIISAACATAMESTIACDPLVYTLALIDEFSQFPDTATQDTFCAADCGASLAAYHSAVDLACGTVQPWENIPATYAGDKVWSKYNQTCLKDTSGAYCTDVISTSMLYNGSASQINDLPKNLTCSACMISFWRTIQATAYSNYAAVQPTWEEVQEVCGISYPTNIQPAALSGEPPIPPYTPANISSCLSGSTYTVKSGDNCTSIAISSSVETAALRSINALLPNCSNVVAGQTLCLPYSCQTYIVESQDSCISIINELGNENLTMIDLISYNGGLNSGCSNLPVGDPICISPPMGTFTPTVIAGATATKTSVYATETIAPPGTTGFGSTKECGKWYQAQSGDYCQVICLSNSIPLDLFYAINPSIDSSCSNILPGLYYCVQPTADWNVTLTNSSGISVTQSLTTISALAPTASGAGNGACYEWYTIVSGDYCFLVASSYGITVSQFLAWNPSILSDCSNLIPGDAYCVSGALSVTSTTGKISSVVFSTSASQITSKLSSSTSSAQPSTTMQTPTSSAVATCRKTYTVVSGDYCYKIWTDNGITEAQLRAWNPSLDAACDLSINQVLCILV